MRRLVILGSWSSGSTALTGFLARCGAYDCPPHVRTNDPRTPVSHEPRALRDQLAARIDEFTLAATNHHEPAFADWLQAWLAAEQARAADQGYGHVVLKHPLLAYFMSDLAALDNTMFIVISRPFAAIEATRQRRQWHQVYGKVGATAIYNRIFSEIIRLQLSCNLVPFDQFRADADYRQYVIHQCGLMPSDAQWGQAEAWISG